MFQIKVAKFWKKNAGRLQFTCCENNIETTSMLFQNDPPSSSSKSLSPLLCCHFVTYNREYYKWLCTLRRHIQVGRLLVTQFVT